MTKEEILKQCTIEDNIVRLPDINLDRKMYLDVVKALELIGGKWKSGKIKGFVFNEDPTELLEQVAGGEKRNLKKEFQFFATPDKLADRLVEFAELKEDDYVLEPSSGQGSIVKAINRVYPNMNVDYFELMPVNRTFMSKISTAIHIGDDFLLVEAHKEQSKYNYPIWNKIIANPPFSKNQDIDHVRKMYEVLADGGRLVSITSRHWMGCNNKKEIQFREWLDEVDAEIINLDSGEFKESGTNIATCILIIDKK